MVKLTSNQQYVVDERTVKIVTIDGTQLKGFVNQKAQVSLQSIPLPLSRNHFA
jgi:hypothetical protein